MYLNKQYYFSKLQISSENSFIHFMYKPTKKWITISQMHPQPLLQLRTVELDLLTSIRVIKRQNR